VLCVSRRLRYFLQTDSGSQGTVLRIFLRVVADGHFKFPHLWAGQIPSGQRPERMDYDADRNPFK
jgi:hypothetical protein